jgi:deoxycytidylate deaminase
MNEVLRPIAAPELVFGLVAPIGVDLDIVVDSLKSALDAVGYDADEFRLTRLMQEVPIGKPAPDDISVESYKQRIEYANDVRKMLGKDALSVIAMSAIRAFRESTHGKTRQRKTRRRAAIPLKTAEEYALAGQAYILRQLKRPEEVDTLRRVYGRQFILVSAWAPEEQRCTRIKDRERQRASSKTTEAEIEHRARELIEQDANEANEPTGQNVRDAFPLADVFIDASTRARANETVTRFVKLLFGNNWLTPSRDEHAMFIAKSASLRSSDLSRQVGAAVFSPFGEVMTLGCNEVPKATGGTYWEGDPGDARDFQLGGDANEAQKFEVLVDLVERLQEEKMLSAGLRKKRDARTIARLMIERPQIEKAKLMDLIEFGRMIHAESAALADASRKGISVRGATLYCTTFPCHLCATNIVAAGVMRVVYIEPYPKSYASHLHKDAITLEKTMGKVSFEPFVGVAPYRYRDLFERKKRKRKDGKAEEWKGGEIRPLIDVYDASYTISEARLVGSFKQTMAEESSAGRKRKRASTTSRKAARPEKGAIRKTSRKRTTRKRKRP